MNYYTVKEIEEIISPYAKVVDVHYENKWIVITLYNGKPYGLRIKIQNY